jgi:uncharacterized protein
MTQRRTAVITGGSSGIGAATAAVLARDGWRVVLVARGAEALTQVRDQITAEGGAAVAEAVDAADGDAILALADRVVSNYGAPEVVVNAAGAGEWRFIEDSPPADARRMMGAPYQAAYNVTHAFMPALLERRRGVLIHVGSPASITPWPGATAYAAARWALRGLHEALRQDLVGTGVQSCHVIFGEVTSPYFEANAVPRENLPTLSRWVSAIAPEECAAVILDTIRRPRPEVIHPRKVWALVWAARLVPPLGRRVVAHGAPRH